MDTNTWLFLILVSLVLSALRKQAEHKQLMRLLSDLATMIGDGIDAIIEVEK